MKTSGRVYLGFLALSGAGWLCDFATFTLLVKLFGVPAFVANFVSSYVGVTFVWFTSLKTVFGHAGPAHGKPLLLFWSYQFASILAYSQVLHLVADGLATLFAALPASQAAIAAKVVVTPFNLATNFLFMKLLTRFMQRSRSASVS
ncbi:MAG: hypothetical protein JWQ11_4443 [Rhizobacter sp.]|nr:hypothetical protein [Rhizobacter sp.]